MKKCIFKFTYQIIIALSFVSCATQHEQLMCDAIRFSDQAKTSYPLDQNSKGPFAVQGEASILYKDHKWNQVAYNQICNFIRDNTMGNATAGYYALELGLDRVSYMRGNYFKNDPVTRFYIIYVTDGEDNASGGVAKEHGRIISSITPEEYAKRIQRKVKRTMGLFKIHQNTFQIFPIRFVGKDVSMAKELNKDKTDAQIRDALRRTMEGYRGASKGSFVPEVILGSNFKDISNNFQEMFAGMSFTFSVNTGYKDKRIRMVMSDGQQTVTMEGTLKRKLFRWVFEDLSLSEGVFIPKPHSSNRTLPIKKIRSISNDPTLATFRVDDFKVNNANFKVYKTAQHFYDQGIWKYNSEYDSYRYMNTNSYVLLIMDESNSLGEEFNAAQEAVLDMLKTISGKLD